MNTEEKSTRLFNKNILNYTVKIILLGLCFVIILFSFFPTFRCFLEIYKDSITSLGVIVSFITIILLVVQIEIQKRDLEQNILEFKQANAEASTQTKLFEKQTSALLEQSLNNTFFKLIDNYHSIVNQLEIDYGPRYYPEALKEGKCQGKEVFNEILYQLDNKVKSNRGMSNFDSNTKSKVPHPIKDSASVNTIIYIHFYIDTFEEYSQILSHTTRNAYNIFRFIHVNGGNRKRFYNDFFRSQLSESELILFGYNSLVDGYGWKKFNFLINKYNLLQSIDELKVHGDVFYDLRKAYVEVNLDYLEEEFE